MSPEENVTRNLTAFQKAAMASLKESEKIYIYITEN